MPETISPIIIIDTREQAPLQFTAYPTERGTLPVADYGLKGFSDWDNPAFAIERKSLSDLCGSLGKGRERFMREIEKLRQFRFRALVIEADRLQIECGQYTSGMSSQSILATLDAIVVRAGVHVVWAGDSAGAALQVESMVRQFVRGVEKDYKRLAAKS